MIYVNSNGEEFDLKHGASLPGADISGVDLVDAVLYSVNFVAPDELQDLLLQSARASIRGDLDTFGPGDHAYARLCDVFDVKHSGGSWAVLAAWRLGSALSAGLADIEQLSSELELMQDPLFDFAECAGVSINGYWIWLDSIEAAIHKGKGDLTVAARLCSEISHILADGATKLLTTGEDLSKTDIEKITALRDMYAARSGMYLAGPMPAGRYLPDELLLSDQRIEWGRLAEIGPRT